MKAKDMSNLYWFCQSVLSGGYAAASQKIGVSAPTLSRAVSQLEERLGEKLIHRNAKQFQLTSAGEGCYEKFAPVFQQLDEQWVSLDNSQPELSGDIRISCPETFVDYFLQQRAFEFMAKHPGVNIQIVFAADTHRFFDDQIDLAVITTPTKTPHLVQRRLLKTDLILAAAPDYLATYGFPAAAEDLTNHHLLVGNSMTCWDLKQGNEQIRVGLSPRYSVNSLRLAIQAACAGVGICLAPGTVIGQHLKEGVLEQVLPEVECLSGDIYMVWADRKLISARVAAFRDMIFERMAQSSPFLN